MPPRLIVGPPGAGKTRRLLTVARAAAASGRRVAWVAMPHQHDAVLRRLAAEGTVLGVEVLGVQRLLYRLLAEARALRPLVTGTERLALVGSALHGILGSVPSPGEATLFASAVAEAKRHALAAEDVRALSDTLARGGATDAAEVARLADVLAHYREALGDRMDYDDARTVALALARADGLRSVADVIVVDGFRELGVLDLALFDALAQRHEVWMALPRPPDGRIADEVLAPRAQAVRAHAFANTVAEARWVLRAVKSDLAAGIPAVDLAVVVPAHARRALLALAEEFGVPLVDDGPASLADTTPGHVLLELLELAEFPTPERLLAVPELEPLARAALDRGVAGPAATAALAGTLGLGGSYARTLELLTPRGDLAAWAAGVVDHALALAQRLPRAGAADEAAPGGSGVRDLLLLRAHEAMRLGVADAMRPWWAALVRASSVRRRARAGVALLTADTASGRRFERAYVLGASIGAYSCGEREDYFVPEDARRAPGDLLARALDGRPPGGLPRRHRGGDAALAAELLARGAQTIVTVAESDRGGPLRPDPHLVGAITPAPVHAAGSELETVPARPYRPPAGAVVGAAVGIEGLRRSDPCTFRVWAERLLPEEEEAPGPPLARLRRALTQPGRLEHERVERLAHDHPEAVAWLAVHDGTLARHVFGVRLPARATAPGVRLDAVERDGGSVRLVRFLAEGERPEAVLDPARRWTELYAARTLLRRPEVDEVTVVAWPLLGDPVELGHGPFRRDRGAARLERLARDVDERWRRWREGPAVPTPGRHCARCAVRDLCREASV